MYGIIFFTFVTVLAVISEFANGFMWTTLVVTAVRMIGGAA